MKQANAPRRDIYESITSKIVNALEEGIAGQSWRRPWKRSPGMSGLPHSIDGRAYRGINVPVLMSTEHASNVWGTYRAWQGHGAQVRKGEKGELIVFWKRTTYKAADEEEERQGLFAKGYHVFAAEQVEGFDLTGHVAKTQSRLPCLAERLEHVDRVTTGYFQTEGLTLAHGGDRAFYAPSRDHIQMPLMEAFTSTEGYYATLLHEAGHSTGHERRLNRQFGGRFGDDAYAFEELVAELASAMLGGSLNITDEPRPDHARYLASWLGVLKRDKRAIFTAASKAQAAADHVMQYAIEQAMPVAA